MQLYKVTLQMPWGTTIGYWRLTKAEVRMFRRKGSVKAVTEEERDWEKRELARVAQKKQIAELVGGQNAKRASRKETNSV